MVVAVALLHVVVIGALVWWNTRPVRILQGQITWLEPGSFAAPAWEQEPTDEEDPDPTPNPAVTPEPESTPELGGATAALSEIPLPTPKPSATPSPAPSPKPSPSPTPKSTPKPTPKTTPKPSPKPSPKASPKASPKPSPKASPKASPKTSPKASPAADAEKKNDEAKKDAAGESTIPKATAVASAAGASGGASGTGSSAGGGGGESQFGIYHEQIHDRFFSVWDQPTSIAKTANFVTGLRIRIASDGTISSAKVVRSSGNVVMDESVQAAAQRVLKINPPPAALISGGAYEVTINFELE